MDGITINTGKSKQIVKLLNALPERLGNLADRAVEQEMEKAVQESVSLASRFEDSGTLAGGIRLVKKRRFFTFASTAPYAAALEFGTGAYLRIPAGYERMAAAAKGRVRATNGVSAKQRIYAWAERHGIPQRKKFFIYRRIMRYGMPKWGATAVVPHFLPAYIGAKNRIVRRLKGLLTRAINGNS